MTEREEDKSLTINGVPLVFNPPCSAGDNERLLLGVPQSAIDAANKRMNGWRFVETRRLNEVPVYEVREDRCEESK